MCGLFGWHGRLTLRERETLSAVLAYANVSRGKDSWGFAGSHNRRTWEVKRGLGKVPREARAMSQYRALMAHTRHATKGAVSLRNAHPFRRGDVLLSHNGAVWNFESLKANEPSKPEVDSELLALRLGADADISDLDGYGVFTWIDLRTGEALLCQPSARGEIALANVHGSGASDIRGVVYSSDDEPLEAALKSAGLSYTLMKGKAGIVYSLTSAGVFESLREPLAWRQEEKTPLYVVPKSPACGTDTKAPTGAVHSSQAVTNASTPAGWTDKDETKYREWLRQWAKDQYGLEDDEISEFLDDGNGFFRV